MATHASASASASLSDKVIVRAAIHPAIGIARVGNSPNDYFFGPEVVNPKSEPTCHYKDGSGALKRQAALFRVYGYNAAGEVVEELTLKNAEIGWSAHVANVKAAWYEFQIALDIPEALLSAPAVDPSLRRNADIRGPLRSQLAIDPGPRSITGPDQQGPQYRFDSGKFFDKKVYLGELRTDGEGRLIFLGGHGVSASKDNKPPTTFANNDGWHDDVSDGPVVANVKIGGKDVPCEGAWVVVAPPNYAPDLKSVRTMYDLLHSMFVDGGAVPEPATVSFRQDILPILARLSRLQWVNQGFFAGFGWGSPVDFENSEFLRQLSQKPTAAGDEFGELRRLVLNSFRVYGRDGKAPAPWPWMYGDSMSLPPISERQHSTLAPLQMRLLGRWAAGDFVDDHAQPDAEPRCLQEVEPSKRPQMLDKAALDFCLADAFHPGCEITWVIRHVSMFSSPYRIRHRLPTNPEPNYGSSMTPEKALMLAGPLHAQPPGGLTRWMAVPWQTDTASCNSGYDRFYDPYLPTFWAARVPNQVLTEESYQAAKNPASSPEERMRHFRTRKDWFRTLQPDQLVLMIKNFGHLGIIEAHHQPEGETVLPAVVYVESKPKPVTPAAPAAMAMAAPGLEAAPAATAGDDVTAQAIEQKLRRFH